MTAISVGRSATCAVIAGGGLMCWGDNTSGLLGTPNEGFNVVSQSSVPVRVPGF